MSFEIREEHYIEIKDVIGEEKIPPIESIYAGDIDGDNSDELLLLSGRFAYLLKPYDLSEEEGVEIRKYIPNLVSCSHKSGGIVDYDNDGRKEVAILTDLGELRSVLKIFRDVRVEKTVEIPFRVAGMTIKDLDNDGYPEFIIYGDKEGADRNLMIIKKGEVVGSYTIGDQIYALDVGDVDGDGANEIVMSYLVTHEGSKRPLIGVLKIEGGKPEEIFKVPTKREVNRIIVDDADKDGIAEIYVMSPAKVSALRYFDGRIEKERDTPEVTKESLMDIKTGDVDDDGYIELLVLTSKRIDIYEHGILEAPIEGLADKLKGDLNSVGIARINGKTYIVVGLKQAIRLGSF